MDALDLRILSTMGYVPWSPTAQEPDRLRPSWIAGELDVTPETVRDRLAAMEEAGVIRSWQAYPNPRHLGLRLGGWAFCPSSREAVTAALDEILLVDGVIEVLTYRGPLLGIALADEDDVQRDRRLALLARRLDDADPVHIIDPPLPSVDRELDGIDWRIVAALRGRARRPLSEVADDVERSYRTVKRRFDRMTSEGSLFLSPRVDLSRIAGVLPFTLALTIERPPTQVADELEDVLGDRQLHRLVPPDPKARLLVVGAWAHTVAEMGSLEAETEALESVEEARAILSAGRRSTDWLDERIRSGRARA